MRYFKLEPQGQFVSGLQLSIEIIGAHMVITVTTSMK